MADSGLRFRPLGHETQPQLNEPLPTVSYGELAGAIIFFSKDCNFSLVPTANR